MDFFQIVTKEVEKGPRKGEFEIAPDFVVGRSKDLMVQGRSFYAIWDEGQGLWSRDEYDVQRLVDMELKLFAENSKVPVHPQYMRSFKNKGWVQFRQFMSQISDNSHPLDESLTFANTEVKKTDYVSRRLPYAIAPGDCSAWNELVGTLYSEEERAKIEWAIGAVISGDSKKIQKFLVFYGPAGTGKSTILNIIQKLFDGYTTTFEAKALGSNNGTFATEVFRNNPLVAIQHDGDLSKMEDNTKLNSIISHEEMTMHEKYKPAYTARANAFLLMGTNQPVRISDAKSGIIRRLIDVHPSGLKFLPNHYHTLMSRIDFELGAIAHHCLSTYQKMGKNYYASYRPLEMMFQTDIFFNFVEANYDIFKAQDGISLRQAYALYKEFCTDTGIERALPQYKVREELRNYFEEFHDRITVAGSNHRSYYTGFKAHAWKSPVGDNPKIFSLVMDETTSIFDLEYAHLAAQLAKEDGTPQRRWSEVKTSLGEIDTTELHYVQVPENHIVIDFDLKDDDGGKSLEKNLEAASSWPATYAELSKSGAGVHLHYLYEGDAGELNPEFSPGIEVKVYSGNASLRRRLSKCNNVPISSISSGLPLKEKKVLHADTIQSERGLRELITRNLRKEIHPGTKPSIDFIQHILDEAYLSGMDYNLTDMRSRIIAFANNSSNQSLNCLRVVQKMKFKSAEGSETTQRPEPPVKDDRLVFFDVEVYPNLFVICWKFQGDPNVVRMINPSSQDVERLFKLKLVGFNVRRYDNHILYGAYLGYDNEMLYKLSQKLIAGTVGCMFGEAFRLSYADVYDFSSKKQGLKKFQIELGIHHMEMNLPWDQPVAPKDIPRVVEYCVNDVISLEVVFEARKQDFVARQILAELSGLTVNDTTQKHAAKIIFGDDKNPQREFVYTKLANEFPGYIFDKGKSTYLGEDVGEGGYVYAEPGMYDNVALLDVASMHPTSIEQLNLFGSYTPNFAALKAARLAIKHKDYVSARKMFGGRLAPYLEKEEDAKALSDALKIIINIVYGLTSAKFDNPFRDIRNVDNIVAKRGALFMIDLKRFVRAEGFDPAHIKTDSIKIPNATPEIIEKIMLFGEKYGYTFEHEGTYDKFCLVNDAVYIARKGTEWTAVGAQFQHSYVFKTLFSREEIVFQDLCETKEVKQGAIYLGWISENEPGRFVGRTGRFTPVVKNGYPLVRVKDGKAYAVTGTKGFQWVESDVAKTMQEEIDLSYFKNLAEEAIKSIDFFGPYTEFVR